MGGIVSNVKLSGIDIGIVILFVIGITALGLYFTRMQRTTKDYFLGGRNLPWWAVMLSIVATETSAATFIAAPADAYAGSLVFLQITFGYLAARIILGYLFVPQLYKGEHQSIYKYLEGRFGMAAKNIAGITFFVTRALATGIRIYIPALVVSQIIPAWPFAYCVIFSVVIALIYTSFGGFRAVVWTEVLMFVIYICGGLVAMLTILGKINLANVFQIASNAGKFKLLDFHVLNFGINYTVLSGFIGGCFLSMATHGTDQTIGQRLLACRNQKESRRAIIGSGIIIIPQFLFFLFIGIMLFAFYFGNSPTLGKADEIFPYFIIHQLPAGFVGLVIAAIFAAAMSTTSSDVNALANIAINDFYKIYIKRTASELHYVLVSKLATVLWGGILIFIAFIPRFAPPEYNLLAICLAIPSLTYGALLGTFLLGFLTKQTDQRGVITGAITGAIVVLVISFFPLLYGLFPDSIFAFFRFIPKISWPWFCPIGCLTTMGIGYGISVFFPQKRRVAVATAEL
jgi:SSS family solute:Na+ symporter